MSLLAAPPPRVFALPPGADFATLFARGFEARFAGLAPELRARAEVMVSTERARRAIAAALAEAAGGTAILPRVTLVTTLGADPLACPDLPPAIAPMRRHLRLLRLVEAYLARTGEAPAAAAPHLADALAGLLDELQEEGVPLVKLEELAAGDLPAEAAAHWQRTLRFLAILREHWPRVLAEDENGALDPRARQRAVVERLLEAWRATPPGHPVIAAGSTGALATTAEILAAVAGLPTGAVVLPGFDRDIEPEVWDKLGPEHPMAPFRRLLNHLHLAPADVRPWVETEAPVPARLRLLRAALRPAPVTDAWRAVAPSLAGEVEEATAGLALVEAPSPRHEAAAVALAIRRVLERPSARVALVTAEATLARRVTAELARFEILPDDSLGRPLAETPPAVFLRLVAELAHHGAEPVRVAALLGHPLMQPGIPREAHLPLARRYELAALRGRTTVDLRPGKLPPWPRAEADPAALAWLAAIEKALAPLARALHRGAPLDEVVAAHIAAGEALSRPAEGAAPALWERQAGEALRALVDGLARHADAHGREPASDYLALFRSLLEREHLRPEPERPHPRVMIWGAHEARVPEAEVMILGGLNEGSWPAPPGADPWLSRPMRAALGLPSPDAVIGLAAHDFLNAACRREVVLSRAVRAGGAPTVASRWLVRLETLLGGLDDGRALEAMRGRGRELLAAVDALHRPTAEVPRAARPRPRPPASARPRRWSVTRIERLIRDAYAVYAERILGLVPLEPLGRAPDFLARGSVLHRIMERFGRETRRGLPEAPADRALLLAIAEEVLAEEVPWPDMRRLWRGRLVRVAPTLLDWERRHRVGAEPLAFERPGRLPFEAGGVEMEITARADRIDRSSDGTGIVIDYKAGRAPTKSQIDAGFYHQLHIQAAMLAEGAFADLSPLPPGRGVYIGLGGTFTELDLDAGALATHMGNVRHLLGRYARETTGFLARGRPFSDRERGDYDHLARRGEWEGEA